LARPARDRAGWAVRRIKRQHFFAGTTLLFQCSKRALQNQHLPFSVAFEERPPLPYERRWLYRHDHIRRGSDRLACCGEMRRRRLLTGGGQDLCGAMAIHQTRLWTLAVVPTIDLLQQWRFRWAAALFLA